MTAPLSISTRRLWLWLPPAFFFSLSLLCLGGIDGWGSKAFYVVLTAATGYWLFRAWRVGVDIIDEALVIRGQVRTHYFDWTQLRRVTAEPMRTVSPFQRLAPYVALTIELADGRSQQFEEVSAAASSDSTVQRVVDALSARL